MSDRGRLDFGAPADEAELRAYQRLVSQAFFRRPSNEPEVAGLIERHGLGAFRVARLDGRVAAGLQPLPLGQWFGGRRVPMIGLSNVVVSPEARAGGLAAQMLARFLAEERERGAALSMLFTRAPRVYRRVGYELAGVAPRYRQRLDPLPVGERALRLREVGPADEPTLQALHVERARRSNGIVDRGPRLWRRLLGGDGTLSYLVERDGLAEGYIVYHVEQPAADPERTLVADDLVALTPAAGRRLLAFLADHRSSADRLTWPGPPTEPLMLQIDADDHEMREYGRWMLRLIDLAGALEARGYAEGFAAELPLDVEDQTLPWNRGRLRVTIEGGRARARPGGDGRLKADVRGLAALYSGYLSPAELGAAGLLEGPERDLAALGLAFAGPLPWTVDQF